MHLHGSLRQDTQSLYTSVWYDDQFDIGERLVPDQAVDGVLLIGTALEWLSNVEPARGIVARGRSFTPGDGLEPHLLGKVAPEECRVDDETLYVPRRAQLDDGPVEMALGPGPRRLPAVSHVLASAGVYQVVLGSEMLVAAGQRYASVLGRRQIEDDLGVFWEDGHGMPVQTEPGDAAVGVHVQPDMGVLLRRRLVELPGVSLRRSTRLQAEDGLPAAAVAFPREDLVVVGVEAALDGDSRRVVAIEESRVNLDAFYDARGYAQADHDPIKRSSIVPSGLPTVIPGTAVHHLTRLPDGGSRRK